MKITYKHSKKHNCTKIYLDGYFIGSYWVIGKNNDGWCGSLSTIEGLKNFYGDSKKDLLKQMKEFIKQNEQPLYDFAVEVDKWNRSLLNS